MTMNVFSFDRPAGTNQPPGESCGQHVLGRATTKGEVIFVVLGCNLGVSRSASLY